MHLLCLPAAHPPEGQAHAELAADLIQTAVLLRHQTAWQFGLSQQPC